MHFTNFTVHGKAVTSQTDSDASWNINAYVSSVTFSTPPPTTAPPSQSGACEVGYTMNSWNDGFTASIRDRRRIWRIRMRSSHGRSGRDRVLPDRCVHVGHGTWQPVHSMET
ncbi:hypothetical protein [Micromonospora carbonacea]|uniref:hypothetical protein n=1 Tax=Micromonospora carbonacea TaxID=47853 RepID=UPI0037213F53